MTTQRIEEIDIRQCCDKRTVSREDGRVVLEKIKKVWDDVERIRVNFANLKIASVSFMDEAFGQLALEHSQDELKSKLEFANIREFDRALLNDILLSRFRQRLLIANKKLSPVKVGVRLRKKRSSRH